MFALFTLRFKKIPKEGLFWLVVTITPLVTAFPVFYWNYLNEWISFKFQTAHGFADPSFDLTPGLRTLLGQLILLTPFVVYQYIKSFKKASDLDIGYISFWTTAPLGILLFCLSFYKQVLPHWIIPTVWLSLPLICSSAEFLKKKPLKVNLIYGGILILIITSVVGVTPLRNFVLAQLNNKTGSLAELTIWDYIKTDSKVDQYLNDVKSDTCQTSLASLRWFSTAQIAARYPNKKVFNLDRNYTSYYAFRDKQFPAGCPVVLIGNKKHFKKSYIEEYITIQSEEFFSPKYHGDHSYILLNGVWK